MVFRVNDRELVKVVDTCTKTFLYSTQEGHGSDDSDESLRTERKK